MWKLVKAELGYIKPFLLLGYLVVVIQGLFFPAREPYSLPGTWAFAYSPWESLRKSSLATLVVPVAISLLLLYFHMREHRVRQTALLPLSKPQIVIARLMCPLLIVASFIVVALIPIAILTLIFHNDVASLWRYYTIAYKRWIDTQHHHETFSYFILTNVSILHTYLLALFLSYALWLFSEHYGRVVLGLYVAFTVFHTGILPLFNPKLAWAIFDSINEVLLAPRSLGYAPAFIPVNLLLMIAGCILVISVSFARRKSFLW